MVKNLFTDEEQKRLSQAIEDAEKETRGEIVMAVFPQADAYVGARLRLALLLVTIATGVVLACFHAWPVVYLIGVQIVVGILGWCLGRYRCFLRLSASRREMDEEVRQRARELFLEERVHTTEVRAGVLIFISLLEHDIEVVADTGWTGKVSEEFWKGLVDRMAQQIRQDSLVPAVLGAVQELGQTMKKTFPGNRSGTGLKNDILTGPP